MSYTFIHSCYLKYVLIIFQNYLDYYKQHIVVKTRMFLQKFPGL